MGLRCQPLQVLEAPRDALVWVKTAIEELNADPKCSNRWKKVLMGAKDGPKSITAVLCGKDQFLCARCTTVHGKGQCPAFQNNRGARGQLLLTQGGQSPSVQYGQIYGPNGWAPVDHLPQENEGGRGNRGRGGRGGRG
mmetsp:Transcript_26054/g.42728  ORF Transcript_26054/g.42728 Transcript_26054/m.42728 type:complete len:138 (-) Transcript_26054:272-685(-)